jgi:DNA-binding PadR family transcriptional regulator
MSFHDFRAHESGAPFDPRSGQRGERRSRGHRDPWRPFPGVPGHPRGESRPNHDPRSHGGSGEGAESDFGGPGWGGFGPPFGGPPFGPRGWGGRGRRGGGRAARGDVRAAILNLLAESPMHGYQIMTEIRERSGGVWKASPGSVYPTLQQLEDEGMIRSTERDGRKVFDLTDAGRTYVNDLPADARTPWNEVRGGVDPSMVEFWQGFKQLAAAGAQITQTGNPAQLRAAKEILNDARRKIYRLLAEDDVADEPAGTNAEGPTADA